MLRVLLRFYSILLFDTFRNVLKQVPVLISWIIINIVVLDCTMYNYKAGNDSKHYAKAKAKGGNPQPKYPRAI